MMSFLREPFTLPEDISVLPLHELPESMRRNINGEDTDFTISRPRSRQTSKLISPAIAELLDNFKYPRTIVQAVANYSLKNKLDPETTLLETLPILRQFIMTGYLIPENGDDIKKISPTLETNQLVGGYLREECIQVLEDSELYLVSDADRKFAVLKIAREGKGNLMRSRIDREAQVLKHLDQCITPKLIEKGTFSERPYLIISWSAGIDAVTAGSEYRAVNDHAGLLHLLISIVRAYSELHEQGIIHGDVHPGNVLVGRDADITLIDFGLSNFIKETNPAMPRGGVAFFYEPEYVSAYVQKHPIPPLTTLAEQYSIGALLYLVATGQHYIDFSLQSEIMYAQIINENQRSFEEKSLPAWLDLEKVLARALSKHPKHRFATTVDLEKALSSIRFVPSGSASLSKKSCSNLFNTLLNDLQPEGRWFRDGLDFAPYCSVNSGMAGIAYALHRISTTNNDSQLLALADLWINKTLSNIEIPQAFYSEHLDITPKTVGRVSPYHTLSGPYLVNAIIAHSLGDFMELEWAQTGFLAEIDKPNSNRDLTLGHLGTVLGSAIMLEKSPAENWPLAEEIKALSQKTLDSIWNEVHSFDSIETGKDWANIGIAHGWGGLLYTTLRWHQLTGNPIPEEFSRRCIELIRCAYPTARGLSWPWRAEGGGETSTMPGWCNGAAGLVHLGCLAHKLLGDDHFLAMAEGAAWQAWEADGAAIDLCCGLAGRAYALLCLFQHNGEPIWLKRAQELTRRAVSFSSSRSGPDNPRYSLFKGELGLVVLIAELEATKIASMPMFGEEN